MKNYTSHRLTLVTLAMAAGALCSLLMPFAAWAAVDVSDTSKFSQITIGGQNVYVDNTTGLLYDGSGQQVAASGNGSGVGTFTQTATGKAAVPVSTDCSSWTGYITNFGTCFGRQISYVIGSTLIYISAWILAVTGIMFNWLVDHTVIQFATTYGYIKSGVETAWTAFRDVANILIIGMFTFIAISIILGIKEFGEKRFVARILIIAVLINFSLLFAKVIIDGSNFVATQLYAAAGFTAANANSGTTPSATFNSNGANPFSNGYAQAGIAGQFINLLGVSGFSDTYKSLESIGTAQDSGKIALLHGLFSAAILLGAAIVLFYGSFLLAARAIILVFLMITASVAFASYLIPKWGKSSYGWSTWWESLLWGTVFAPLLMFFLWASLSIGTQMHSSVNKDSGSIGAMLTDPTNAGNLNTFFVYVFVLGLLFVSLKLSSTFSRKIAGIDFASTLTSLPLTLGSRFIAAPLLRRFIGANAAGAGSAFSAASSASNLRASQLQMRAAQTSDSREAAKLRRQADRTQSLSALQGRIGGLADKLAGKRFNLMDTEGAKQLAKVAGLKGFATGASSKDTKGYADQMKEKGKDAVKEGPKVTEDQKKAVRESAATAAAQQHKQAEDALRQQKKGSSEMIAAVKKVVEKQQETIKLQHENAKEDVRQRKDEMRKLMRSNEKEVEDFRGSDVDRQEMERRHQEQMRDADDKIGKAQQRVNSLQARMDQIATTDEHEVEFDGKTINVSMDKALSSDREIDERIRDHTMSRERTIREAGEAAVKNLEESRVQVTERIARQKVINPIGIAMGDRGRVAKEARTTMSKDASAVAKLTNLLNEAEVTKPAKPSTPAAPSGGPASK